MSAPSEAVTRRGKRLSIRLAEPSDQTAVQELCTEVFGEVVGEKAGMAVADLGTRLGRLGAELSHPVHSAYWLAFEPETDVLLGMIGLFRLRWLGGQNLHLGWFAVRPSLQGQGIGHVLLDWAKAEAVRLGARSILVETAPEPQETVDFYARMGFAPVAQIEDVWEDGETLLLMRLYLTSAASS